MNLHNDGFKFTIRLAHFLWVDLPPRKPSAFKTLAMLKVVQIWPSLWYLKKKKKSSTVCSSYSEVSNTFYFADHRIAAFEDQHGHQSL